MKKYLPFVVILIFVLSNIFSYQYGVKKTHDRLVRRTTFYATITDIEEDSFFVKGIDLNEEQFQGYFKCFLSDNTYYDERDIPKHKEDFKEGDIISITFFGNFSVQLNDDPEKVYGIIKNVHKIILLKR